MGDGHWIDPRYTDVYHGQANGRDGSAWVFAREHTEAGLFVEVHHLAPNGPLLRRISVAHEQQPARS